MSTGRHSTDSDSDGESIFTSTTAHDRSTRLGASAAVLAPLPSRSKSAWKQPVNENQQGSSEDWKEQIAKWEKHIDQHRQVSGESIFQIPYPKQFIIDGVLHQFKVGNNMKSLDLFWDLVFVGAIQKAAKILITHTDNNGSKPLMHGSSNYTVTASSFGNFILIFTIMWKIWVSMDHWSQIFGTNDLVHRFLVVWQMCLVLTMGSEVYSVFKTSNVLFIACFLLSHLTTTINYIVYFIYLPLFRGDIGFIIVMNIIPMLLWLGSIWVDSYYRWILWTVGATIELLEPLILWATVRVCARWGISWRCHLALNVKHTAHRYGEFIMLTLGEYVLSSFYNGKGEVNQRLGCTVIGMVMVACIHWIYFNCEGSIQSKHALLRSYTSSFLWTFLHRPIAGFLTIGCFSMSHITTLTDKDDIPNRLAWLLTVGIGGAVFCLALLGLTHKSLDDIQFTHVSKPVRICLRAIVGIVIIMVALVNKYLEEIIYLPGIVMFICLTLILFEMVGRIAVKRPSGESSDQSKEADSHHSESGGSGSHQPAQFSNTGYATDVHDIEAMSGASQDSLQRTNDWINSSSSSNSSWNMPDPDEITASNDPRQTATRAHANSPTITIRGNRRLARPRTLREYDLKDLPGAMPMG